jgi:hypothetical protein
VSPLIDSFPVLKKNAIDVLHTPKPLDESVRRPVIVAYIETIVLGLTSIEDEERQLNGAISAMISEGCPNAQGL